MRPDRYCLEVSFIRYRARTVDDIQIGPGARLDIGSVLLRQEDFEDEGEYE